MASSLFAEGDGEEDELLALLEGGGHPGPVPAWDAADVASAEGPGEAQALHALMVGAVPGTPVQAPLAAASPKEQTDLAAPERAAPARADLGAPATAGALPRSAASSEQGHAVPQHGAPAPASSPHEPDWAALQPGRPLTAHPVHAERVARSSAVLAAPAGHGAPTDAGGACDAAAVAGSRSAAASTPEPAGVARDRGESLGTPPRSGPERFHTPASALVEAESPESSGPGRPAGQQGALPGSPGLGRGLHAVPREVPNQATHGAAADGAGVRPGVPGLALPPRGGPAGLGEGLQALSDPEDALTGSDSEFEADADLLLDPGLPGYPVGDPVAAAGLPADPPSSSAHDVAGDAVEASGIAAATVEAELDGLSGGEPDAIKGLPAASADKVHAGGRGLLEGLGGAVGGAVGAPDGAPRPAHQSALEQAMALERALVDGAPLAGGRPTFSVLSMSLTAHKGPASASTSLCYVVLNTKLDCLSPAVCWLGRRLCWGGQRGGQLGAPGEPPVCPLQTQCLAQAS